MKTLMTYFRCAHQFMIWCAGRLKNADAGQDSRIPTTGHRDLSTSLRLRTVTWTWVCVDLRRWRIPTGTEEDNESLATAACESPGRTKPALNQATKGFLNWILSWSRGTIAAREVSKLFLRRREKIQFIKIQKTIIMEHADWHAPRFKSKPRSRENFSNCIFLWLTSVSFEANDKTMSRPVIPNLLPSDRWWSTLRAETAVFWVENFYDNYAAQPTSYSLPWKPEISACGRNEAVKYLRVGRNLRRFATNSWNQGETEGWSIIN